MPTREEVRQRLREDGEYYALNCLKLANEDGVLVPFKPRKGQRKIEAAIQAQQQAGKPVRIIILKNRRIGSSSWSVGTGLRYLTQHANRKGLVVAQDRDTAGELHDIANVMYSHLPDEDDLKPPIYQHRNTKDGKLLWWGEPSTLERRRGNLGLNSILTVDTAKEVDAGRGKTIHFLLATEVAVWPDPGKAISLFNAVYDRPGTIIIVESTAKGFNAFKDRWDAAARGEGAYTPVFIGWTEDENCVLPFADPDERRRFIETVGSGPWGEDEPRLVEMYDCTPEQLNWRRFAIVDKCNSDLSIFDQEYPSDAARAFIGSGKHVFSIVLTQKAIDRCEQIAQLPAEEGGPIEGILKESATKTRRIHDGTIEVPTGAEWFPAAATGFPHGYDFWTRWEVPDEDDRARQYIVAVDPSAGEANTSGDRDYHAIQVLDHRTREQVARLRTQKLDPDELAYQALLAAMFFNDALISVETTGGYGVPVVRKLWDAYGWRRLYKRKAIEQAAAKTSDRLGWDTNRRTKPLMVEGFREMLREGTHGLRDVQTVLELTTYVTDDKGRQGADASAHDDMLSAYMQGQEVARETRLRPDNAGEGVVSTWARKPRSGRGW